MPIEAMERAATAEAVAREAEEAAEFEEAHRVVFDPERKAVPGWRDRDTVINYKDV